MIEIDFTGAKELNAALKRIATDYPKERDKFLKIEAEQIKGRAKLHSPVDTGRLRNAWKRTQPSGGSVEIFNNVEYAIFVEMGHRVKIHGKFTGGVVEGAHMLRDAIDESKDNFQADAKKILARLFGK